MNSRARKSEHMHAGNGKVKTHKAVGVAAAFNFDDFMHLSGVLEYSVFLRGLLLYLKICWKTFFDLIAGKSQIVCAFT